MDEILYITRNDVSKIHEHQIRVFGGDSGLRANTDNCVESAIAQPQQHVFGVDLYPTISAKAAGYLFHLSKDHCFADGNKRVGLQVALVFLHNNGHELRRGTASPKRLARLTLDVVENICSKEQLLKYFCRRVVRR